MSLDKAIPNNGRFDAQDPRMRNKEKRKPYRKSKAFDRTCRNHGSCSYCECNRTIANKKREQAAKEQLKDL